MSINIKSPHEYLNATVVGTPTISEGVVSGFTTSNYLRVPTAFNHGGNSWEIVCKLATGRDVTTINQYMTTNSNQGISLLVEASHFNVNLSSNGSSFDIASNVLSSYVVLPNTEYWVKVWFDGAAYRFSYSLDGEIYNTDIEVTSSKKIYDNGVLNIGVARLANQPWLGSIDLNESYIKINGEYWWRGVEVDQYKEIKRLYKYDKPTYYKYGTEIDANVTGSFGRLDKGVASGFSASNYLTTESFDVSNGESWERVWKVTTGTLGSAIEILDSVVTNYTGFQTQINTSGNLYIWASSNGTSWNLASGVTGSTVLQSNTDYWIKEVFTGTAYQVYLSTTGEFAGEETLEAEIANTAVVKAGQIKLGAHVNQTTFWSGSIDLSQSYININGSRWWSGDNYTKVGSWIDDGVVRGFTSANYLNPPSNFTIANGDTWEFFFKCKTPETFSTYDVLYRTPVEYNGVYLSTKGNVVRIILSSNGTSYNMGDITSTLTLETNTDYYIKYYFTGSQYKVDVSTDSLVWENYITLNNSTSIYSTVGSLCIGAQSPLYTSAPWGGSIDLNQSYIKINDKMWWHGTKVEETTADDYEWFEKKPMLIKQVYKTDKTKYYKYVTNVTHENWTQPTLSANGTIGGESFAVSATSINASHYAWYAFDKNTSTVCQCKATSGTFSFYNPVPLNITKLVITGYNGEWKIQNCTFSGSNNNADWEVIATYSPVFQNLTWDTPNDKYYKYFKIDWNRSGSYGLNWKSLDITATQEITTTIAVESTIDDYDYKELIPQLVYEHNPTVFQQSTAGTYTFVVTEEAPYEITLVGGGGGGAFNSSGNAGSAAAGNSGSGLVVNAVLKAGTYVLNVGAGGAWSGWLDANTWGGNGSQSSISKDGVVLATAGGGTGNHAWWRSGSAHNSTVGAAPTYTDALGVTDVILNRQGNWGGLAATSSGGASVISGTTWGKGGDTRNRNAADNGNAGCIRIVRKTYLIRRYYKNIVETTYEDWTQPTLSTNGTVGGDNYACRADSEYRTDAATYQAYKAFDGNTGSFWSANSKTYGWVEFYSPVELLPTKVTLTNRNSATNPFKNVTVTGSLDGSEYFNLATYTNTNSANSAAWDVVIDNPQVVKYVRVAGDGLVTSNTLSQAEMKVTAQQKVTTVTAVESTIDDYDFYVDEII